MTEQQYKQAFKIQIELKSYNDRLEELERMIDRLKNLAIMELHQKLKFN